MVNKQGPRTNRVREEGRGKAGFEINVVLHRNLRMYLNHARTRKRTYLTYTFRRWRIQGGRMDMM
jgi:hypothetical protein